MRASIRQTHNFFGVVWEVLIDGRSHSFKNFEVAVIFLNKRLKRMYKEASAYSMARTISANMLAITEQDLVRKLCKNKCKGISPKQYGFLKGIHERQGREFMLKNYCEYCGHECSLLDRWCSRWCREYWEKRAKEPSK